MTELRIRKVGSSLGLLLPAHVCASLNVREGDSLFLQPPANGVGYVLTALGPEDTSFVAAAREGARRYRGAMQALAEERDEFDNSPSQTRRPKK